MVFKSLKKLVLTAFTAVLIVGALYIPAASGRVSAAADNKAPVVLTSYTRDFQSSERWPVMTTTINFNVWAADNVTSTSQLQYRQSENPSFAGVAWGPYSVSRSANLSLAEIDDETTLYIQIRDQAGNVRTISIEFFLVSGLGCGGLNTQQAVHRFWSDQKQTHFYTSNEAEKNYIIANYPQHVWKYERVAYKVLTTGCYMNLPVYRFWSDQKQSHFYTSDPQEAVVVRAKNPEHVWKYERVDFADVSPHYEGSSKLVHRFWSDQKQSHFYTISEAEKNQIIATYPQHVWRYEGTAFRAIE